MSDTNTFTVLKDSRNRPALIIANDLSSVAFGETIPENTLGFDKDTGSICRLVNGSWSTALVQSSITGAVNGNVSGDLTGSVTTDAGGDVTIASIANGNYFRFGTTQEDFTYTAGVDGVFTGTAVIPDNAYILSARVQITAIIAGDDVAKLDVGLSVFTGAGDPDALTPTQIATVTAGVKQRQMFKFDAIGPTAADFITVSAFKVDGTTPSEPTSGSVRVTLLWVELS